MADCSAKFLSVPDVNCGNFPYFLQESQHMWGFLFDGVCRIRSNPPVALQFNGYEAFVSFPPRMMTSGCAEHPRFGFAFLSDLGGTAGGTTAETAAERQNKNITT